MVYELGVRLIQDNGFFDLVLAIVLVSIIDRLEQKIASLNIRAMATR
jgi:hypothetical protein